MKKIGLVFGLLILFFVAALPVANAQFFYPPPPVPFYGYGYGYLPAFPPTPPAPYRNASVLASSLLGLLPATTLTPTVATPTLTITVPTSFLLAPATTPTIGVLTILNLTASSGGTVLPLLTSLSTATLAPVATTTIGAATSLLLGGSSISSSTLLALGI